MRLCMVPLSIFVCVWTPLKCLTKLNASVVHKATPYQLVTLSYDHQSLNSSSDSVNRPPQRIQPDVFVNPGFENIHIVSPFYI